jgi:hypothetical protein
MSSSFEVLRSLLVAHYKGDEGLFRTTVLDYIENERLVNRNVAAGELERILNEVGRVPKPRRNGAETLHGLNGSGSSPKDK